MINASQSGTLYFIVHFLLCSCHLDMAISHTCYYIHLVARQQTTYVYASIHGCLIIMYHWYLTHAVSPTLVVCCVELGGMATVRGWWCSGPLLRLHTLGMSVCWLGLTPTWGWREWGLQDLTIAGTQRIIHYSCSCNYNICIACIVWQFGGSICKLLKKKFPMSTWNTCALYEIWY